MKREEIERWEKRQLDDAAEIGDRSISASPQVRNPPGQQRNQSRGPTKGNNRGKEGSDQEVVQRRDHGVDREDKPGVDEKIDDGTRSTR